MKSHEQRQLKLEEILYHLKVEYDIEYLPLLLEHKQIREIVTNAHNRHKCKIKILEQLLLDYVIHEYEYSEIYTEERFEWEIKKYLGKKARELMYGK